MTSNLAKKRFGHLVVLGPTGEHAGGFVVWRCRCDCGNEIDVPTPELTRGQVYSCGKLGCVAWIDERLAGDLVGKRVGRLTVRDVVSIGDDDIVYRCACDCGNDAFEATRSELASGLVRSCGCIDLGKAKLDLTGERFGLLTVVEPTGRRERNCVVWRCQCDCGNVCEAPTVALTTGATKSCGCLRRSNLAGLRFGHLTALEPTSRRVRGLVVWKCICDCGREIETLSGYLTRGSKTSCGSWSCPFGGHGGRAGKRNIAGERFGRLVAVRPTGALRGGSAVWECACDCGASCEATQKALASGAKLSCGCLRGNARGHFRAADLAGRRFGMLVALEPTDARVRGSVVWRCACDCGGTRDVDAFTLKRGHATSCGCAGGRRAGAHETGEGRA